MKKITSALSAVFLVLFLMVGHASAVQYSFFNITHNSSGDAAIGEAQVVMDVTNAGAGQVLFTFSNSGPLASSITDIYFDGTPLLTHQNFVNVIGAVSYGVGASPGNLPGGNDPLYNFSADHSYDSNSPTQPNGINPLESLGILFQSGSSFNDILAALDDASLRVGLHVQGFASGGSESFIDTPSTVSPVPEPGTMLLLGTGLLGLAVYGKRRMNREA